jgi:hypothetical protein
VAAMPPSVTLGPVDRPPDDLSDRRVWQPKVRRLKPFALWIQPMNLTVAEIVSRPRVFSTLLFAAYLLLTSIASSPVRIIGSY